MSFTLSYFLLLLISCFSLSFLPTFDPPLFLSSYIRRESVYLFERKRLRMKKEEPSYPDVVCKLVACLDGEGEEEMEEMRDMKEMKEMKKMQMMKETRKTKAMGKIKAPNSRLGKGGWLSFVMLLTLTFLLGGLSPLYAQDISLYIDGRPIEARGDEPGPFIDQGRTLVPIRLLSEELGAQVDWQGGKRQVLIEKDGVQADLRIDNRLMAYDRTKKDYGLVDVAPLIRQGRTFVPLRVVSYVLDIAIDWDPEEKKVSLDSSKPADRRPFFSLALKDVKTGQLIQGKRDLSVEGIREEDLKKAAQLRFILADPDTMQGRIVSMTDKLTGPAPYLPAPEDEGEKILLAGLYDKEGELLSADLRRVRIDLDPKVSIRGEGQRSVSGNTDLSVETNFRAHYLKYHMLHEETGKSILTDKLDPYGTYTFRPSYEDRGSWTIYAMAYDREDESVSSLPLYLSVQQDRVLSLTGVSPGQRITDRVSLNARRNFDVSRTQYLAKGQDQEVQVLADKGYGSHTWLPSHAEAGLYEVWVRVWDTSGKVHDSDKVSVTLDPQAFVKVRGVGPGAVVTEDTDLSLSSNVEARDLILVLKNKDTGREEKIALGQVDDEVSLKLEDLSTANYSIRGQARYADKTLKTEEISFRVFKGKTYGARPVTAKDDFRPFISDMARVSRKETAMSAALQTAQAILETGWGQSIPVDKYKGTFSNNLFGIKGSTSYGSVVSNTWEEYNGVAFRTDASFRAYASPQDSWNDHKALLLRASRYQIFRDVMADPVLGAYAIRRAGYATDSRYPTKLIDIMDRYQLWELDKANI